MARNTERHHSWSSDLKLRHAQVKFVSANGAPSKEPRDLEASTHHAAFPSDDGPTATERDRLKPHMSELSLSVPMSSKVPVITADVSSPTLERDDGVARNGQKGILHAEKIDKIDELFIIDTSGFPNVVRIGLPPPPILRSPSPTGSDSSEEVIVFGGRAGSQRRRPEITSETHSSSLKAERLKHNCMMSTQQVGFTPLASLHTSKSTTSGMNLSLRVSPIRRNTGIVRSHLRTRNPGGTAIPKTSPRSTKGSRGLWNKPHESEVLADCITNTQAGEQNEKSTVRNLLNGRELGGCRNNVWEDEAHTSSSDVMSKKLLSNGMEADWSEGDLNDFDELSTSNEILGEITHVLSKRERTSGLQYLIVCEGYTFDDARWIPLSSLDTPGAQEKIILFDKGAASVKQYSLSSQGTDGASDLGDLAALDLEEALDDLRDEEDLLKRKQSRMTDEKLARLLSKQEELGLGSDELVLFDGDERSEATDVDSFDIVCKNAMRFSTRGGKRNGQRQGVFDHAGFFADVLDQDSYGGFDIMDQDRSSLRKRSKGYRGMVPFELSDTELMNTINLNWEKDREKKKMRKLEREELRTQGLLGKKDKVNMKAKYPEGMSYSEIKSEVRNFMLSASERYNSLHPAFGCSNSA